MKKITDEKRQEIIDLYYKKNLNYVEISKEVNISRITISNIIQEYIDKTGLDIKKSNVYYLKKKDKYQNNLVNIPTSFLEGIDINVSKKEKDISIILDKNRKEIKIKKRK